MRSLDFVIRSLRFFYFLWRCIKMWSTYLLWFFYY